MEAAREGPASGRPGDQDDMRGDPENTPASNALATRRAIAQRHQDLPPPGGSGRDPYGRFRPGASGNPRGRPVGCVSLTTRMRRVLLETVDGNGEPLADLLAKRLVQVMLTQPVEASGILRTFMDRDEGKAVARMESDPADTAAAIREALAEMDASVPDYAAGDNGDIVEATIE